MAFKKLTNEFKATIILALLGIPLIASTNIDCNGKSFHCVNSTHFMICVDLGGGVSTTVDDFVIPCPPTTGCLATNRFECEFEIVPTHPPVLRTSEVTNELELSATTQPWEEIAVTTNFPPNNTSDAEYSDLKTFNTVSLSTVPSVTTEVTLETISENNNVSSIPVDTVTNDVEPTTERINTENVTLAVAATVTETLTDVQSNLGTTNTNVETTNTAMIFETITEAITTNVEITTEAELNITELLPTETTRLVNESTIINNASQTLQNSAQQTTTDFNFNLTTTLSDLAIDHNATQNETLTTVYPLLDGVDTTAANLPTTSQNTQDLVTTENNDILLNSPASITDNVTTASDNISVVTQDLATVSFNNSQLDVITTTTETLTTLHPNITTVKQVLVSADTGDTLKDVTTTIASSTTANQNTITDTQGVINTDSNDLLLDSSMTYDTVSTATQRTTVVIQGVVTTESSLLLNGTDTVAASQDVVTHGSVTTSSNNSILDMTATTTETLSTENINITNVTQILITIDTKDPLLEGAITTTTETLTTENPNITNVTQSLVTNVTIDTKDPLLEGAITTTTKTLTTESPNIINVTQGLVTIDTKDPLLEGAITTTTETLTTENPNITNVTQSLVTNVTIDTKDPLLEGAITTTTKTLTTESPNIINVTQGLVTIDTKDPLLEGAITTTTETLTTENPNITNVTQSLVTNVTIGTKDPLLEGAITTTTETLTTENPNITNITQSLVTNITIDTKDPLLEGAITTTTETITSESLNITNVTPSLDTIDTKDPLFEGAVTTTTETLTTENPNIINVTQGLVTIGTKDPLLEGAITTIMETLTTESLNITNDTQSLITIDTNDPLLEGAIATTSETLTTESLNITYDTQSLGTINTKYPQLEDAITTIGTLSTGSQNLNNTLGVVTTESTDTYQDGKGTTADELTIASQNAIVAEGFGTTESNVPFPDDGATTLDVLTIATQNTTVDTQGLATTGTNKPLLDITATSTDTSTTATQKTIEVTQSLVPTDSNYLPPDTAATTKENLTTASQDVTVTIQHFVPTDSNDLKNIIATETTTTTLVDDSSLLQNGQPDTSWTETDKPSDVLPSENTVVVTESSISSTVNKYSTAFSLDLNETTAIKSLDNTIITLTDKTTTDGNNTTSYLVADSAVQGQTQSTVQNSHPNSTENVVEFDRSTSGINVIGTTILSYQNTSTEVPTVNDTSELKIGNSYVTEPSSVTNSSEVDIQPTEEQEIISVQWQDSPSTETTARQMASTQETGFINKIPTVNQTREDNSMGNNLDNFVNRTDTEDVATTTSTTTSNLFINEGSSASTLHLVASTVVNIETTTAMPNTENSINITEKYTVTQVASIDALNTVALNSSSSSNTQIFETVLSTSQSNGISTTTYTPIKLEVTFTTVPSNIISNTTTDLEKESETTITVINTGETESSTSLNPNVPVQSSEHVDKVITTTEPYNPLENILMNSSYGSETVTLSTISNTEAGSTIEPYNPLANIFMNSSYDSEGVTLSSTMNTERNVNGTENNLITTDGTLQRNDTLTTRNQGVDTSFTNNVTLGNNEAIPESTIDELRITTSAIDNPQQNTRTTTINSDVNSAGFDTTSHFHDTEINSPALGKTNANNQVGSSTNTYSEATSEGQIITLTPKKEVTHILNEGTDNLATTINTNFPKDSLVTSGSTPTGNKQDTYDVLNITTSNIGQDEQITKSDTVNPTEQTTMWHYQKHGYPSSTNKINIEVTTLSSRAEISTQANEENKFNSAVTSFFIPKESFGTTEPIKTTVTYRGADTTGKPDLYSSHGYVTSVTSDGSSKASKMDSAMTQIVNGETSITPLKIISIATALPKVDGDSKDNSNAETTELLQGDLLINKATTPTISSDSNDGDVSEDGQLNSNGVTNISSHVDNNNISNLSQDGSSKTEFASHGVENFKDNNQGVAEITSTSASTNEQITFKRTATPLLPHTTESSTIRQTTKMVNVQINQKPVPTPPVQSPQFDCRNRQRGSYGDRYDCRKFYICMGHVQPVTGLCPATSVFSEIKTQCTKNLSHCIRDSQFKCITEGRFSDYFREATYYICVKNKHESFVRFKFQCQKGYHLNKTTVKCVEDVEVFNQSASSLDSQSMSQSISEKKSKEDESVSKKEESFECKEEGKFADPNNCRKYYVCTVNKKCEYRRKKKKCNSDEVFDKDKKKCVDAESYEC